MRIGAIIVLIAAAVLLLGGSLTASWGKAETDTGSQRWGLTDLTECDAGGLFFRRCKTHSLSDMGWDATSVSVGRATFAAGAIAVLAAIACAVFAGYASKAARVAGGISLTTAASSLIGAAVFIIFLPDDATDLDPELGSSFYLFTMGGLASLVGSAMAARDATRAQREADGEDSIELPPHLGEHALPGAPRSAMPSPVPVPPPVVDIPTCETCGGSAVWMPQTRHFACVRCNRYV